MSTHNLGEITKLVKSLKPGGLVIFSDGTVVVGPPIYVWNSETDESRPLSCDVTKGEGGFRVEYK